MAQTPPPPPKWFLPNQCGRTTLEVLRDAKASPLSAREIALQVMERCGTPTDNVQIVKNVTLMVRDFLKRREGSLVRSSGANPCVWCLAPD
jgi:hypothetical protein